MWLDKLDSIESKNAYAGLPCEPGSYRGVIRSNVTVSEEISFTGRDGQVHNGKNARLIVGLFRGAALQVEIDLESCLRGGVEADGETRIGIDIAGKLFWASNVAGQSFPQAALTINQAGLWVDLTLTAHTCKSKAGNAYTRLVISRFVVRKATEQELQGVPEVLELPGGLLTPQPQTKG